MSAVYWKCTTNGSTIDRKPGWLSKGPSEQSAIRVMWTAMPTCMELILEPNIACEMSFVISRSLFANLECSTCFADRPAQEACSLVYISTLFVFIESSNPICAIDTKWRFLGSGELVFQKGSMRPSESLRKSFHLVHAGFLQLLSQSIMLFRSVAS